MQSNRFEMREIESVLFCRCLDERLIDAAMCQEWSDDLFALVDRENRSRIVIDYSLVVFKSSRFLNSLIILDRKLRERGGQLILQAMDPAIYEVFAITRLTDLFRITQTEEESLRLMAEQVAA